MAKIPQNAIIEAEKAAQKKDKQGNQLIRKLSVWHSGITRTFEQSIADGFPIILLTSEQQQELDSLLQQHYRATARAFSPFHLNYSESDVSKKPVVTEVKQAIIRDVDTLIRSEPQRTQSITETTENHKGRSLLLAREAFNEEQAALEPEERITPANAALAITAGNILKNRLKNHRESLAISETNWVAEGTRQIHVTDTKQPLADSLENEATAIEAQNVEQAKLYEKQARELSEITESETAQEADDQATSALVAFSFTAASRLRNYAEKVLQQKKMWITMGDNRVRASHRAANGQRQSDTEPFQVGSSELMYPADGSLGADVGELVNCRCYVYYL